MEKSDQDYAIPLSISILGFSNKSDGAETGNQLRKQVIV